MYLYVFVCVHSSNLSEWSIVYVVILVCVLATAALCSACYFSFKNKTRRLVAMKASMSNGKSSATSNGGARSRRTKYTRLGQDDPDFELRSTYSPLID